jgi:hypothetical protein
MSLGGRVRKRNFWLRLFLIDYGFPCTFAPTNGQRLFTPMTPEPAPDQPDDGQALRTELRQGLTAALRARARPTAMTRSASPTPPIGSVSAPAP